MITLMTVLSYIIAILIFGIIAFVCVEALLDRVISLVDRFRYDSKVKGRYELANEISRDSYWFSESADAMFVLQTMSKHINKNNGYFDISAVRDEWRDQMEKRKNEQR